MLGCCDGESFGDCYGDYLYAECGCCFVERVCEIGDLGDGMVVSVVEDFGLMMVDFGDLLGDDL